MLGIGAGDVEFIGRDALAFIQNLNCMFVIFSRIAKDVRDDYGVLNRTQLGKFFFDECARANVLQSNCVQHPSRGFV